MIDISPFTDMITRTDFGVPGLVGFMCTLFFALLITRKIEDIKVLLLPMALLLMLLGFYQNIIFLILAGLLYVTSIFDLKQITSFIETTANATKQLINKARGEISPTRDIAEESKLIKQYESIKRAEFQEKEKEGVLERIFKSREK